MDLDCTRGISHDVSALHATMLQHNGACKGGTVLQQPTMFGTDRASTSLSKAEPANMSAEGIMSACQRPVSFTVLASWVHTMVCSESRRQKIRSELRSELCYVRFRQGVPKISCLDLPGVAPCSEAPRGSGCRGRGRGPEDDG